MPRKYPPHFTPPPAWTVETRQEIHAFMFFTPNWPYIWMLQQKSRLIRPGNVFQSSIVQFWWSVWIVSSVCCSYLTGAAPGVVFCCWSPSASGFDVLCVQRWYSADLGCNEWLFKLLLLSIISNQSAILLWPLTSTRHFHPHNCRSLDISLFQTFSVNPRDGCVWKSQ